MPCQVAIQPPGAVIKRLKNIRKPSGGTLPTAPLAISLGMDSGCWDIDNNSCEPPLRAYKETTSYSLRATSLTTAKPSAQVLATWIQGLKESPVPAVADNGTSAFVVYRANGALEGIWTTLDGKKEQAVSIARGDIGAPAVIVLEDQAWVVWPARENPNAPYKLYFASASRTAVSPAKVLATGTKSVFAPTLTRVNGSVQLAWMEGDATAQGALSLARLRANGTLDARVAISRGPNDREPRLAAFGETLYLAWPAFAKNGKAEARLLPISCKTK